MPNLLQTKVFLESLDTIHTGLVLIRIRTSGIPRQAQTEIELDLRLSPGRAHRYLASLSVKNCNTSEDGRPAKPFR